MFIKLIAYLGLLLVTSVAGVASWSKLRAVDRLIAVLMILTLLAETSAFTIFYNRGNSFIVYHLYNPIQFLLVSLYFNRSTRQLRKHNVGLYIGSIGLLLGILNSVCFQRPTNSNSYFLLFEGTVIIIYCLLAFHQILLDEELLPFGFAHFWITVCFLIFWTTTFTGWGIYAVTDESDDTINSLFDKVLTVANFVFYGGIASVFLNYKKLIPSGA